MSILRSVRRLLRPPRVVSLTRRPAGWFAVGRRRLHDVVAWGQLDDGHVVGLVAGRRGLRVAGGRGWLGYLPGVPRAGDVQLSPPAAIAFPVADLVEAIDDDLANPWTPEAQAAIYSRLRIAAEQEWAGRCLSSYVADSDRFLRRFLEMLVEHQRAADLDESWRAGLAGLAAMTEPPAPSGIREDHQ